jgi:5-hydroxyisourate hydrolase-like protein (transthyretin family)
MTITMRTFLLFAFVALSRLTASAATLTVEVDRNGFTGPIQITVAPRVDGQPPHWSAPKLLGKSTVRFDGLEEGLYVLLASGPQPLQRLSAKANVGTDGTTVRLTIPQLKTTVRVTMAGQPLADARIALTHDTLRWDTKVATGEDGSYTGDLWEPGVYSASVTRNGSAPHSTDVSLSREPLTINVPDRHVTGRVTAGGKPLAGAIVHLRAESPESTLTVRTRTNTDGRFEYLGVREGTLQLTVRAPSYLDSDAVTFDLHGAPASKSVDVALTRGAPRAVRVVDAHNAPVANANLLTSCGGHVKSMAITDAKGTAEVALPAKGTCAVYVLPKKGSLGVIEVSGSEPLVIRVPEASSSLKLALKSVAGEPFPAMSLLMRVDGIVVPPAISRMLASLGFSLMTNEEGNLSLPHIASGRYEFWPYRTSAEGQYLYETATEFDAPIALTVAAGENNATVKFKAR